MSKPFEYRLARYEDAPEFLRMKFITDGYRVYFPVWECLKSVVRWHNQTMNIHTHLWPAVFFAWMTWQTAFAEDTSTWGERVTVCVFTACTTFAFGASAVFHTFNSHCEPTYRACNKMDCNGITMLIIGTYAPIAYFCLSCLPYWQRLHLCAFSVVASLVLATAQLPMVQDPTFIVGRIMLFGSLVVTLVISTFHICYLVGHVAAFWDFIVAVFVGVALVAAGATCYAVRCPERWLPAGTCDYIFNSHNWLHIFSVSAMLLHVYAQSHLVAFLRETPCEAMHMPQDFQSWPAWLALPTPH